MTKKSRSTQKGFTLVEIMIVVSIIGILISIAMPSWLKAREKSQAQSCMEAQEKMEGAIDTWALDTGATSTTVPDTSVLIGKALYLKRKPICPVGKTDIAPVSISGDIVCPNGINYHDRSTLTTAGDGS